MISLRRRATTPLQEAMTRYAESLGIERRTGRVALRAYAG